MTGTIKRGKITRADLANWDGKTATYTRTDATGGTVTGLAIGNEVDVLQVYGSGTDRTRATIASALNSLGTTSCTLVFAPGTWSIDANLTIPSNFTCHIPRGCVFDVDSGKTLTFSGALQRESETWTSGSGTVTWTPSNNVLTHAKEFWGQTTTGLETGETSASVTPTNYNHPPGDVRRYGAAGDGTTDDTTPILNAVKVSNAGYWPVAFQPRTYITDPISIQGTVRVPKEILGNGATLKAKSGSSGTLLLIENPQTLAPFFKLSRIKLDANDLCNRALKIHGCQRAEFFNVRAVQSTSYGIELLGESGYGIYYNIFCQFISGASGEENGGTGIYENGSGTSYYIAANTFIGLVSQFNKGDGVLVDYSNNPHFGGAIEKNDTYAVNSNHVFSSDWFGVYTENNHLNWATDGMSDGGTDENYSATASNTTGKKVIGGRGIGTPGGTWTGQGNFYMPGYSGVTVQPNLDPAGLFAVEDARIRTGGGLTNTSVAANNLRGTATFASAATATVTFATAEADTNYYLALSADKQETFWVTGKSTTGFTVNSSNATSTATVTWILVR